jgi:hypothetical protein
VISLISTLESGESLEVGLIGRDGFTPPAVFPGITMMPCDGVVLVPGLACRIDADVLRHEVLADAVLYSTLGRFAHFLLVRSLQRSVCNIFHSVEQRCIRWLLTIGDLTDDGVIPVTHDRMAAMLGAPADGDARAAVVAQGWTGRRNEGPPRDPRSRPSRTGVLRMLSGVARRAAPPARVLSVAVSTVVPSRTLAVSGRRALLRTCVAARITWTIATILVVQALVCGAALFPMVMIWWLLLELTRGAETLRALVISLALVPSYVLFALLLMFVSALSVRALNWQTPADTEARIADFDWPVLTWARAMVATHLVRFVAGTLFRASPVWTAYLRLAGARLGRRVYVNSLAVTDYDLLEFGDDVVIGADAHVSGHTGS